MFGMTTEEMAAYNEQILARKRAAMEAGTWYGADPSSIGAGQAASHAAYFEHLTGGGMGPTIQRETVYAAPSVAAPALVVPATQPSEAATTFQPASQVAPVTTVVPAEPTVAEPIMMLPSVEAGMLGLSTNTWLIIAAAGVGLFLLGQKKHGRR